MSSRQNSLIRALLLALVALNVGIVCWNGASLRRRKGVEEISYTYTGNSIPLIHPMTNSLPLISLTLQESTHFSWNTPDNVSRDEFYTLLDYPSLSIMGPNHRMMILSWFHNLHCITQLRAALHNHNDRVATAGHFSHCVQYLRQTLLCGASDILEEGDFMRRNFTVERVGSDLVCYDFEQAQEILRGERQRFNEWRMNGQVEEDY